MGLEGTEIKRYTMLTIFFVVLLVISVVAIGKQLLIMGFISLVVGILGTIGCLLLIQRKKRTQVKNCLLIKDDEFISEQNQVKDQIEKNRDEVLNVSCVTSKDTVNENDTLNQGTNFQQAEGLLVENQLSDVSSEDKLMLTEVKPSKRNKYQIRVEVDSFKAFQRENELISKKLSKNPPTESEVKEKKEHFVQLSLDEFLSEQLTTNQNDIVSGDTLSKFEQQIFNEVRTILLNHDRHLDKIKTKYVGGYFDIVGRKTMLRFKLQGRKKYLLTYLSPQAVKAKNIVAEAPSKTEKYETRIPIVSMYVLEQLTDYILERYDEVC